MAYNMGGRRFRPVGSGKKRTAPQYGPVGTGCPFVEEAVARLYREQNEEHFWSLMNALNYALELQTKVLVPLDAAVDPQSAPPAGRSIPSGGQRLRSQTASSIQQVFLAPWQSILSFDNSVTNFVLYFNPFLAKRTRLHYTERKNTARRVVLWHTPMIGKV